MVDGDAAHQVVHEATEQIGVPDDLVELVPLGRPAVEEAAGHRHGRRGLVEFGLEPVVDALGVGQLPTVVAAVDPRGALCPSWEGIAAQRTFTDGLVHGDQVRQRVRLDRPHLDLHTV